MYGETPCWPARSSPCDGLSPHVRGNRLPALSVVQGQGSIPACTGKPWVARTPQSDPRVYPRMYGETDSMYGRPDPGWGLSPHVRGNPVPSVSCLPAVRSIPACTGKPGARPGGSGAAWVYPRMYGETLAGQRQSGQAPGLSPHVRGNLWVKMTHFANHICQRPMSLLR